jgi:peptidoglycan/LPS O-acetylase OafA/YrhL
MTVLRLLETVHGHLALLAAAVLLHPAWILRKGQRPSRGAAIAVAATVLLVLLAFGSGLFIYGDYRALVRAGLFRANAAAGIMFETKEHLAYGVLATTLGAAACTFLAPSEGKELRRAAAALFLIAAALCLATVALGSYIASVHGFGSR